MCDVIRHLPIKQNENSQKQSEKAKIFQRRYSIILKILPNKTIKKGYFKVHKQNVKGGHKISLNLATILVEQGYECVLGWLFLQDMLF